MGTNVTWTPYFDKMTEKLGRLALTEIAERDGTNVSSLLQSPDSGTIRAFSTEKTEKICVGSIYAGSD